MQELPVINTVPDKPKKPNWLRVKLPIGEEYKHVRSLVDTHKLHTTICKYEISEFPYLVDFITNYGNLFYSTIISKVDRV